MNEPRIIIGTTLLTTAQAMTVRVAVANFQMELQDPEIRKEIGVIADAYEARLNEIILLMERASR